MASTILALATAVPPYAIDQRLFANRFAECLGLNSEERERLFRICDKTRIKNRYSVIADYQNPGFLGSLYSNDFPSDVPKTLARNEIYKKEALPLSIKAASAALNKWGGDPGQITHVISVSCTGVMAPGIEFQLIQRLGLRPQCKRFGINLMGCFGAFQGIALGTAFAKENSCNRVLIVCTELCSLHMQASNDKCDFVSNALFADGAGAILLGAEPRGDETPLWEVCSHASLALSGSEREMTWEVGNHGFLMNLSEKVPKKFKLHISNFLNCLLKDQEIAASSYWAVHPGGAAILEAVAQTLGLNSESDLRDSWDVLEQYGNMSSATFLFVLERQNARAKEKEWSIGLGFGPGLALEGVLLKNV